MKPVTWKKRTGLKNLGLEQCSTLKAAEIGRFYLGILQEILVNMKLCNVSDFSSKEFGSHFKKYEKYLEICWRNPGKILGFYQSENVGTLNI